MLSYKAKFKSEAGFTLIELSIVTLLLVLLSAILYGTMDSITKARERSDGRLKMDNTAHYLFTRMTNELSSRSLTNLSNKTNSTLSNLGSTISNQGTLYLQGTSENSGDNDHDKLRFVSSIGAQSFIGAPSNSGLVEIEYRLEKLPESDSSNTTEPTQMALVREEMPATAPSLTAAEKRKILFPLAENVISLSFRYLKGEKWLDQWGNQGSTGLPEAIEIGITLISDKGQTESYRTAVPISVSKKQ